MYNSRTYSCICLVAEREGRNKSGNLENSTQNTLHIQHIESTKYCHSVVLWVCLVDKSGPAMAGPAGAAPTPLHYLLITGHWTGILKFVFVHCGMQLPQISPLGMTLPSVVCTCRGIAAGLLGLTLQSTQTELSLLALASLWIDPIDCLRSGSTSPD